MPLLPLSSHHPPSPPLPFSLYFLSLLSLSTTMVKLKLKSIHPKHLISTLTKSRSVTKSAPSSFGSTTSSDSSTTATTPCGWSDTDAADLLKFDYIQAFKMIDRDGDGKITLLELESILRGVAGKSVTSDEVKAMIGDIDLDGDGCISLDEFTAVGSVFDRTVDGEDELKEVFDVFDADHDGRISAEELLEVLMRLGDERCTLDDCKRMIGSVDENCDGYVCFREFARMMHLQR